MQSGVSKEDMVLAIIDRFKYVAKKASKLEKECTNCVYNYMLYDKYQEEADRLAWLIDEIGGEYIIQLDKMANITVCH
jgi:hypothetical protein